MFTNCAIVGTIAEMPDISASAQGRKDFSLMLYVRRSFPDCDGQYFLDEFRVNLWRGIAAEIQAVCRVGSVIALKGRLESRVIETAGHEKITCPVIIAEQVKIIEV